MALFRVLLVGAGEINFGSVEGPWNHSLRLESTLGARLRVVGIVDLDRAAAERQRDAKRLGAAAAAYAHARVFISVADARRTLPADEDPQLVVLGVPPFARGADTPGADLELQIARAFPRCALLVEKPVGSALPAVTGRVSRALAQQHVGPIGVGYMLRHLRAVQKMKQIIDANQLTVMGTNARYVMAYEWARKLPWWDKTRSGGPIIEQATHFCDLSRYFGGPVRLPSITAHTVEHDEPPGRLSAQRFDEAAIPPEHRVPRLTSASWKYASGAVGSLMHVVALHGNTYDTELEVYADGYRLKLVDAYNAPTLYVRRPGVAEEEIYRYPDDDPFLSQISAFVEAVDHPSAAVGILSSYEDALQTYELTWHIKQASDASAEAYRKERGST